MDKKSTRPNILVFTVPLLFLLVSCNTLKASGKSNKPLSTLIPTTAGSPSVSVNDQTSDGTSVVVADVFSQGPGWLAIHNQINGKIGDPIGETHLNSGDNKDVVIKIDPTKATPVMYAMLHTDAGQIGVYEFPGPDVPVMVNNEMLAPAFKLSMNTASASTPTTQPSNMSMATPAGSSTDLKVKVSDQALINNSITVDEVDSADPGWIVIYTTDTYGQPDQPIGHAAVKAGVNLMVVVPVDPVKAQGTLFAQLHVDKGKPGVFEYPGVDVPVMVGVRMIGGPFKVTSPQSQSVAATMVMTTTSAMTTTPEVTAAPVKIGTPVALQPSITVSDQAIQNGTVTIAQVVSNGKWWLVIHRQNSDGQMGDYIGATLIKPGINTNVVVKIIINEATPVLYAMLHEDYPPIGVLQFPGPDVPVMIAGHMIAPTFNVTGLTQDITIQIRKLSDTVSYLTDGQGNSLYISTRDTPGKSNCTAACLNVWKPLFVQGRILTGAGVATQNLGIILLPDGSRQVTYLGAPLYYYSKDLNPGDTNGQGVDGVWFLVTP